VALSDEIPDDESLFSLQPNSKDMQMPAHKLITHAAMAILLSLQILAVQSTFAADPVRNEPVEPNQSRDTRISPPANNNRDLDPNAKPFRTDPGAKQDTDSTRNPSANPYDRSIQPTDIPSTRPQQR
jgi:hypothetical protein